MAAQVYVTTFSCHNCAKHIVSPGLTKVVYVEPARHHPPRRFLCFRERCDFSNTQRFIRTQKLPIRTTNDSGGFAIDGLGLCSTPTVAEWQLHEVGGHDCS